MKYFIFTVYVLGVVWFYTVFYFLFFKEYSSGIQDFVGAA
jgi:hypothetical protein